MSGLYQDGRQRRRQGERHQPGEHHGDGDGDRELLVELPGHAAQEGHREEHRVQYQHDCNHGPGHLAHGALGGFLGREPELGHVAFGILDDDDGIIHHDTDGEDHAEQGEHVDREAEGQHADHGAENGYRHCKCRDDSEPDAPQEHEHHQHHQHQGLEEGVHHLVDGRLDELGGIQRHIVGQSVGETFRKIIQGDIHLVGDVEGVGAGLLVHHDEGRVLALVLGADGVVLAPEVGATDVFDACDRCALLVGAQDDVLELIRLGEQPRRGHGERLRHRLGRGRLADATDGELLVLLAHRVGHVSGRDAELRHAVRAQPDAHGIVRHPEDRGLVRTIDALDGIQHIDVGVVRHVVRIVTLVRREQGDDQHEALGGLLDDDRLCGDRGGKLGRGPLHAVLHIDLGQLGIGALLEVDIERVVAGR